MIRRAFPTDIVQVASVYHGVWHETQGPFMPAEECAHRSMKFFVNRMTDLLLSTLIAERSGTIVAFAAWKGRRLGQIFVLAPYRGSSVAPSLMTAAEAAMANEGTTEAELHCVIGNHRARRFYERMSWLHGGEIVEQVSGEHGPVDVAFWRMTKVLATTRA